MTKQAWFRKYSFPLDRKKNVLSLVIWICLGDGEKEDQLAYLAPHRLLHCFHHINPTQCNKIHALNWKIFILQEFIGVSVSVRLSVSWSEAFCLHYFSITYWPISTKRHRNIHSWIRKDM